MAKSHTQRPENCRKQHVVPRFVISGFTDSNNILRVKTVDGEFVETGPGGKYFWDKVYSYRLDDSWAGYEGGAATALSMLKAGAKSISQYDYWFSLMPFMAGTIARDRAVEAELESSRWSYRCVRLTSDQRRCLVFSLMMDALINARTTMIRTTGHRPFLLNDRGYAWSDEDHRLIVPVSSRLALVAEWPDTDDDGMPPSVVGLKNRWKPIPMTRPEVYYRDVNELMAMQAVYFIAGLPDEEVDRFVPLYESTGILDWISEWLPDSGVWSWLDLMREVGRRESGGWSGQWSHKYRTGDLDEACIDDILMDVRSYGPTWLPIWLMRPDKGSCLTDGLSMTGDNVIVDWQSALNSRKWAWIPYKASLNSKD